MRFLTNEKKPDSTFDFTPDTMSEITENIRNLKRNSPGCDELPDPTLKDIIDILGKILLQICNNSFL